MPLRNPDREWQAAKKSNRFQPMDAATKAWSPRPADPRCPRRSSKTRRPQIEAAAAQRATAARAASRANRTHARGAAASADRQRRDRARRPPAIPARLPSQVHLLEGALVTREPFGQARVVLLLAGGRRHTPAKQFAEQFGRFERAMKIRAKVAAHADAFA